MQMSVLMLECPYAVASASFYIYTHAYTLACVQVKKQRYQGTTHTRGFEETGQRHASTLPQSPLAALVARSL